MGTETPLHCLSASGQMCLVKLNNPLMGTETTIHLAEVLLSTFGYG